MQLYLAVTPGDARKAAQFGKALAHVAYRIGPGSTLLRQDLPLQSRGGILSVSDREAPKIGDPAALCAAVLRECGRGGYGGGGAVRALDDPPRPARPPCAQPLGPALAAGRRTLYLPESYAQAAGGSAAVLLCTAISGGNFIQRLREAAEAYGGAANLALDVQRLRMDFRLPAHSGEGEPLDAERFQRLMERETPSVFFSQELCARYFTYVRDGQAHFVLFDDAGTLKQKLRSGASMGFSAAFLMWPEIKDIAGELFG